MVFNPGNKQSGDLLKSEDWNAAMKEIQRLEQAKVNRNGADTLTGPLTIADALNVTGNVGIGTNNPGEYKLNVQGNQLIQGSLTVNEVAGNPVKMGGFTDTEQDEWPKVIWYRDLNKNWDEGLIKHTSRGFFKKAGYGIHFHQNRQFGFWSSGWDSLFAVEGQTGNTFIKGNLTVSGTGTSSFAGSLTVTGNLTINTGGAGSWNKLVVTTTSEWGDGNNQYVTIGAGGASGIMLSNPHITWRDNRASIRYGRSQGISTGSYWDAGVRQDGSFSFALDGTSDNKLTIAKNGNTSIQGNLTVSGTETSSFAGSLTVTGNLTINAGGAGSWNKLVVTTTSEWGDGNNQYVTIGAGGASGIMLSNPHITWRDNRASIRYGRSQGISTGSYWDAGVRQDGSFSFALDGTSDNKLTIAKNGNTSIQGEMISRGINVEYDRDTHMNNDGAFYRYVGQVYISIDDNLYIRDCVRNKYIHIDVANQRINYSSDAKVKKNIQSIKNGLQKILSLRGVTFQWKEDESCQQANSQLGLIAQEVETIFPEIVQIGHDGMKSIHYTGLIAPMIEAIKEQQEQISSLLMRLEEQESNKVKFEN